MQIHSVNQPACVHEAAVAAEPSDSGCGHYVFAAMLEPGYHQFIIYDPEVERAFCKEFILDINHGQIFYPELPANGMGRQPPR